MVHITVGVSPGNQHAHLLTTNCNLSSKFGKPEEQVLVREAIEMSLKSRGKLLVVMVCQSTLEYGPQCRIHFFLWHSL